LTADPAVTCPHNAEKQQQVAKARTLVGLDVHAAKIVAAVLDVETGEVCAAKRRRAEQCARVISTTLWSSSSSEVDGV
jgi:hypothetical protein